MSFPMFTPDSLGFCSCLCISHNPFIPLASVSFSFPASSPLRSPSLCLLLSVPLHPLRYFPLPILCVTSLWAPVLDLSLASPLASLSLVPTLISDPTGLTTSPAQGKLRCYTCSFAKPCYPVLTDCQDDEACGISIGTSG